MNLQNNGKSLQEMNVEEVIEFEKTVLKRLLGASSAGMSQTIIDQLHVFLDLVRQRRDELFSEEKQGLSKAKEVQDDEDDDRPEPEPGLIIG